MDETWRAVDALYEESVVKADDPLRNTVDASVRAGMPQIHVAPTQGKLLHILARAIRARRILEIGTLAGYSTIWLARGVEDGGTVITLEVDARHAAVARDNLRVAGVADRVEVREGPALASLEALEGEPRSFDLVFIDADKESTAEYFRRAVELTRDGGLVIVDNVVRQGAILDAGSSDTRVQGMRRFNDELASRSDVSATVIQTVSVKGYDGLAIALVTRG